MSVWRFAPLALLLLFFPLFAQEPRVDVFGDPLPRGVMMRLGTTRFHAVGSVRSIDLSRDGKVLVVSQNNQARFWDMDTGREIRSVPLEDGG